MSTPKRHIDAAVLRRLAVSADADPRTVMRVLRGDLVRGMVRERIARVLIEEGFLPPQRKKVGK